MSERAYQMYREQLAKSKCGSWIQTHNETWIHDGRFQIDWILAEQTKVRYTGVDTHTDER